MDILFFPDYSGTNPYQRELADALEDCGASVTMVERNSTLPSLSAVRGDDCPDVIHLHWLHASLIGEWWPVTFVKGCLLILQIVYFRAIGIGIVWTAHNTLDHERRTPRLEAAFKHVLIQLCGVVIVHCRAAGETVRRVYRLPDRYRDRFRPIPHGHYIDSYANNVSDESAREHLDLAGDDLVYLYFGRIRKYKNVTELVKTFQTIENDQARLLIVGIPDDETIAADIEAVATADNRIRTIFKFVPESAIQFYMNAADVVVLPFQEVLTSGSVMLALSFGKPVIVPNVGCVRTLMANAGGFTYDPGDLRRTLERAANADLDSVGQENYQVARSYGWDAIGRATYAAYSEITEPNAGRNAT